MAEEKKILEKLSKPLEIKDVDFRIQSISEKGYATILAYKDARVDMNRLDEVLDTNWQCKYELIDGQLFCSIGVKIDGEWIWRQDVGTESMTEKTKGRASDSFKRAGFRWGIGRELYDYPRIFLQLKSASHVTGNDKPEFTVKQSGQKKIGTSGWGLHLKKWTWDIKFAKDGKVEYLVGKDEKGAVRFDSNKDFNGLAKPQQKTQEPVKTVAKAKPKMNSKQYEKAMESEDIDALTKYLTHFDLTTDQLGNLSLRIVELKDKDNETK